MDKKPWAVEWKDVVEELGVSPEQGLSSDEADKRLQEFGPNELRQKEKRPAWKILYDQIKNFIFLLLIVAAVLSFAMGDWLEGVAIVIVIVITVLIGFFTELKAVRSMEALQEMSKVTAKVRRNGEVQEITSEEMVPGDIGVLEAGDIIAADMRLIASSRLQLDESALTGESQPVSKELEPLPEDTTLAEHTNMVYKGTVVTDGSGEGIVVSTGMETELGHISQMTEEAEQEQTPLEKRLEKLGHRLIWITLAVAALVLISGWITGKEWTLLIQTSIALAVAAIPEGLPIVATLALARGMIRMAKRNALMNRLSAVETLGATNVICTDKTGTLTENQMTVTRISCVLSDGDEIQEIQVEEGDEQAGRFHIDENEIDPQENELLQHILRVSVLCNNAELAGGADEKEEKHGDPMEIALLELGRKGGFKQDDLLSEMPKVHEESFSTETKKMATFHDQPEGNQKFAAIKGAPEAVLEKCAKVRTGQGERDMSDELRKKWEEENDRLAEQGLRVLAIAEKSAGSQEEDPYENMVLLGLLGLLDPPRAEVREEIEVMKKAGIRVVMVTGDQAKTAKNIGENLGLLSEEGEARVVHGSEFKDPDLMSEEEQIKILKTSIFSRVTPEQKLNLVKLYQKHNYVVAMTGDGVNDAPALKKADIGIAMGQRGTQVAQEAAAMVLTDDSFNSIVVAIQQGRVIFNNIRKFVIFMLSGNMGEIIIVAIPMLLGAPLPLLPLQILFINMLCDVFPALALGLGKGDPSVLDRPPRDSSESIITKYHWYMIVVWGAIIAVFVLGAYAIAGYGMKMEENEMVTISFLTLVFARLWHSFNMRDWGSSLINNDVTRNPFIWGALVICITTTVAAIYVPFLAKALSIETPGLREWGLILGMSFGPFVVGQIMKSVFKGKSKTGV